jgi:hypothetical protein
MAVVIVIAAGLEINNSLPVTDRAPAVRERLHSGGMHTRTGTEGALHPVLGRVIDRCTAFAFVNVFRFVMHFRIYLGILMTYASIILHKYSTLYL